jgi:hypothetical protein
MVNTEKENRLIWNVKMSEMLYESVIKHNGDMTHVIEDLERCTLRQIKNHFVALKKIATTVPITEV